MLMAEKLGPMKVPEREPQLSGPQKEAPKRTDLPDFDSLLATSNSERQQELDKEKAAAGGDLRIGENKSDKEFREMLEKVTGRRQDKLKNKLEKDDYLNLMVTQLKNQDPTKPMDNQEMATQLAQFNTVEQLIGVNKTLGELKAQQGAVNVDKLAPYLGKDVEVAGNKVTLRPDRTATSAALKLPAPASAVSVSVKDPAGNVVRTLPMGDLQGGMHSIAFDGKDDAGADLPAGTYTFDVAATAVDGKPVEASKLMSVRVEGITDIAAGGKLETAAGAIDVKDIVAVRAPKATATEHAGAARTLPPRPAPSASAAVAATATPIAEMKPAAEAATAPAPRHSSPRSRAEDKSRPSAPAKNAVTESASAPARTPSAPAAPATTAPAKPTGGEATKSA